MLVLIVTSPGVNGGWSFTVRHPTWLPLHWENLKKACSVLCCLLFIDDLPELRLLSTPTIPNDIVAFHLMTTGKNVSKFYSTLLTGGITTPRLILQSAKYCHLPHENPVLLTTI